MWFDSLEGLKILHICHRSNSELRTKQSQSVRVTGDIARKVARGGRRKLQNNDIGAFGELATKSFLETRFPHTLIVRGARCGCLDAEDNDIDVAFGPVEGDRFVAINAKLFLSERDGSVIHSSPEFKYEPHMTVVVELRKKESKGVRTHYNVMLNSLEIETQVQAKKGERLVD